MPWSGRETADTASRIVREIWRHPGVSRSGLAERLSVDKSTVTNQVARLIEGGVVVELEEGDASARGGRKPIRLSVNRDYGRVLGIEIQVESWVAVLVDLAGDVLGEVRGERPVREGNFAEAALAIVAEARAALVPEGARLLGVGVGTGGLIDLKKSVIRYSVPLGISKPIDFHRDVAARLDVPCLIENDANCCAWGELAFNKGEDLRNFLFALVEFRKDHVSRDGYGGMGIGLGIVVGGKLWSGAHGNAGEFRSVLCDGSGELQVSAPKDLVRRAGEDSSALFTVADEVARNVAMLVNTMDFERVFVGGDIESLPIDFPALLGRRLADNWMYPFPVSARIDYSSLGNRAVAFGAAGMVLDNLVSSRLLLAEDGSSLPGSNPPGGGNSFAERDSRVPGGIR